jgi:hypothetical protein
MQVLRTILVIVLTLIMVFLVPRFLLPSPSPTPSMALPSDLAALIPAAAGNLPADLSNLEDANRLTYRILALENPSALPTYPQASNLITDTATNTPRLWGSEQVALTTTFGLPSRPRTVAWRPVSVANPSLPADTHGRIDRVQELP